VFVRLDARDEPDQLRLFGSPTGEGLRGLERKYRGGRSHRLHGLALLPVCRVHLPLETECTRVAHRVPGRLELRCDRVIEHFARRLDGGLSGRGTGSLRLLAELRKVIREGADLLQSLPLKTDRGAPRLPRQDGILRRLHHEQAGDARLTHLFPDERVEIRPRIVEHVLLRLLLGGLLHQPEHVPAHDPRRADVLLRVGAQLDPLRLPECQDPSKQLGGYGLEFLDAFLLVGFGVRRLGSRREELLQSLACGGDADDADIVEGIPANRRPRVRPAGNALKQGDCLVAVAELQVAEAHVVVDGRVGAGHVRGLAVEFERPFEMRLRVFRLSLAEDGSDVVGADRTAGARDRDADTEEQQAPGRRRRRGPAKGGAPRRRTEPRDHRATSAFGAARCSLISVESTISTIPSPTNN